MRKGIIKTKTFWLGVVTLAFGVYKIATGADDGSTEMILGLGMIFGRDAIAKLSK